MLFLLLTAISFITYYHYDMSNRRITSQTCFSYGSRIKTVVLTKCITWLTAKVIVLFAVI